MFEGLVRQLLLGYLGRYVKDIHKDQLKITVWNEEVLLENTELILEAFDYLQLPFALKQGRVGKLSIKIPWKKLGREPIIITLEDVFISASQRSEEEWSLDAIERREFAGKKAKLAAAELAKLSSRMCDNKTGNLFISYIAAKILDSIQVSIRNFHILYSDTEPVLGQVIFGLRFASLTITKQNPVGSSVGKLKGGQVNKSINIEALAIYCSLSEVVADSRNMIQHLSPNFSCNSSFTGNELSYLLEPLNVSVSLLVNRPGKLNKDLPQYSINAELTCLVVSLNEIQLKQILILLDYLDTSRLREKFGRYRPSSSSLVDKSNGWQKLWWQYAQESVLLDIRRKLKKTSWRYLGQRLSKRRKYVTFYKVKLDFLQQELPIDESILWELEQMEKDSDIDDILSYRSAAECELQEVLTKSSTANLEVNNANISVEKLRSDEHSSGRSRGWLNWLSRGMLGAGGTDDSSQFSGVVSDEVVKDIYEATEFHPQAVSTQDSDVNDKIYICAIKFNILEISARLHSVYSCQEVAKFDLLGGIIECKIWEELATIDVIVNSGKMVYPCDGKDIVKVAGFCPGRSMLENVPSCRVQVDINPKENVELSVKVRVQPLEVTCNMDFFLRFIEFFTVLKSFKFQQERVLSSLNGLEDVKARLLGKAEYIFASHKKVKWDVSIVDVIINVPCQDVVSKQDNLVLEMRSFLLESKFDVDSLGSSTKEQPDMNFLSSIPGCDLINFQLGDIYDHFEIKLNNLEIKLMVLHNSQPIHVLENVCASVTYAFCIIPDESIVKQLEVDIVVSSIHARLSPTIHKSVVAVIALLDSQHSRYQNVTSNPLGTPISHFTVAANLGYVSLDLDLGNDGENSSAVTLCLQELDVWYSAKEIEDCWICIKALEMITCQLGGERESRILLSSGNPFASSCAYKQKMSSGFGNLCNFSDRTKSAEACFLLHYEACRSVGLVCHKYTVFLGGADLHCYPYIFGLLAGFCERMSLYSTVFAGKHSSSEMNTNSQQETPHFGFQKFGFSNFIESGSSEFESISLDHYPFVTIKNSGPLGNLEGSLLYSIPEWRKLFNLRGEKFKRPNSSLEQESKKFLNSPLKFASASEAFPLSGAKVNVKLFVADINLCGIRVHFHDSSCIVGTVRVPTFKSSVMLSKNFAELVCSAEGLSLTSSWSTKYFHDSLWGPALPNLSPILNVRVRKDSVKSSSPQLEISIGIQHVCCILPLEYLAIIIGYFSLPEWSSNSTMQPSSENVEHTGDQNRPEVTYTFEILDSTLIFPVETEACQYLKIEIPQLYCSYILNCASSNVLWGIPTEYLIPVHKVAKKNHCLNIFGRDLSLLFLLSKDDGDSTLAFYADTASKDITLVAPLSADVWVRIPCESGTSSVSTCIMSRISVCQLIVDDSSSFTGFEALLDVIYRFSLVQDESKRFTSDIVRFIQSKSFLRENSTVSLVNSSMIVIEVRCCVDSMLIKLHLMKKDSVSSEAVAKADMSFICAASLVNETLVSLDLNFALFGLCSLLNSVMLAQCTNSCPDSSVLDITLLKSDEGGNELHVSLPSLDIWLHFFDWTEVIKLYDFYARKLAKVSQTDSLSEASASIFSMAQVPENSKQETTTRVTVKSKNICFTIHYPFWSNKEASGKLGLARAQERQSQDVPSKIVKGKECKFITVAAHSRSCELYIVGRHGNLKLVLDKMSGTLGTCEAESVTTWPLFQTSEINFVTEIHGNGMQLVRINLGVQCDQLDMSLSHQVLSFCFSNWFQSSEERSYQFPFGGAEINVQFRKMSLLISDGRWSCSGPLLEILLRNFLLRANATEIGMESSITCDLEVNYTNRHKVLWEPFLEPWEFEIKVIRKHELNALVNNFVITDLHLGSATQLNLNFTESLLECFVRTIEMVKDAWGMIGPDDIPESQRLIYRQITQNTCGGSYAPYILQNLTSLPLTFHVYQGIVTADVLDASPMVDQKYVQPGASVPIYLNDSSEGQPFHNRASHYSDKLIEKQSNGMIHNLITIQLDGTSMFSAPLSMDLVGLTYFEVDFSKGSNSDPKIDCNGISICNDGLIVPVVFDVSLQRHSKLIRLYSTVIIFNATSMPLELRFEIPFGVSPKILDPVYPGQEFALPLHLAEAGRMRWRPYGNSYLWSEAHSISNVLSQDSKMGFLRSFVCYPSHPSSEPFRCCISVQDICLRTSFQITMGSSFYFNELSDGSHGQISHDSDHLKKRFLHQVTLSTPLVVNNHLPEPISLTIESGGSTRTAALVKVETFFHHIDPSHDLSLEFSLRGFKPSSLKFPRIDAFSAVAKFNGMKFSQAESLCLYPDLCSGPVYVTVEKVMDVLSGARELFISVPFLLYNCTGFPLIIQDHANETKGTRTTLPSCYDLIEQEILQGQKDGLGLISSNQDCCARISNMDTIDSSFSSSHIISTRVNVSQRFEKFPSKPLVSSISSKQFYKQSEIHHSAGKKDSLNSLENSLCSSNSREAGFLDNVHGQIKACMYCPHPSHNASELMVRVSQCLPGSVTENVPETSWSASFSLVPPGGSTNVLVPRSSPTAAFIISVTGNALSGVFSGRTQAITFQPRYVISNACSKDISYKQKGTNSIFHLGVGQHSHFHWIDTARELLVALRFDEPGWQWSGSFLPDHLGDTQVKMRNYVSGALNMIRVEVQNADVSMRNAKIFGSFQNSATNLILLSDDDMGYMPYRIDNFSKERLRIYQQKCETFDSIVHPYTSLPYAWDEPCYPHRLVVEVPGERIIGSYALDDLKEHVPVYLPRTREKPERRLFLSVYAEGAMKVLSIIDSSYHILKDMKDQPAPRFQEKRKNQRLQNKLNSFTERFSVAIPYLGISLINSYPQELVFACAKNITVDLVQSLDQQKLSFQISSLQVDNQLHTTPYPVILSFNPEQRGNPGSQRTKDGCVKSKSERMWEATLDSCESAFYLTMTKWRKKDVSLASFEHITLRVADFQLELEQELILSLLNFVKTVSSSSESGVSQYSHPSLHPLVIDSGFLKDLTTDGQTCESVRATNDQLYAKNVPISSKSQGGSTSLPSIVPIGAPWQKIYILARRQKKIYVELFYLAPVKFTLSFSSAPWMLRNGILTSGESLIHRGLMALADVEGAQIHLKQLLIAHHMASWESFQEIFVRHYTWQLLHEMYKVFGSAGVIGNPMGFARSLGLGIRDFLSVPAKSVLKSPTGLLTGMAQGTTSLVSNTVYALSDAATQFSKAAHKGIVAFTFDDHAFARMEKQQKVAGLHSKGVINEVFEGLTGLLQSPIKEAEKHGLPGVLSGIAFGVTGLVARPAASILEVTGKTAQSIRNRSRLHHTASQRYRLRLPRPLRRELPLKPYSWEEAAGASVLMEADDGLKLKDEVLIKCKALKQAGKFVIITKKLLLVVSCSSLMEFGSPEFRGVAVDHEWVMESEIGLDSIIHADTDDGVVHIVGSSSNAITRQNQYQSKKGSGARTRRWNNPWTPLPLFQTNLDLDSKEDADEFLQVLLSMIELGKGRGWGVGYLLHRTSIK